MRTKAGSRWRIEHDLEGPRIRLGVAWFIGALVALAAGPVGHVLYFGVFFAAAASHTVRTWRARGSGADPRVALLVTAALVAAAGVDPRVFGVALLAGAVGVVGVAVSELPPGAGPAAAMARAALTLQAVVPCALAGGCLVVLAGHDVWVAMSLLFVAGAYDSGDFLIGAESASAAEGPVAGMLAVAVVTLVVVSLGFLPYSLTWSVCLGALAGPGALAGQYLASAMLPHSRALAPALRRVDSLLVTAPLWYLIVRFWAG